MPSDCCCDKTARERESLLTQFPITLFDSARVWTTVLALFSTSISFSSGSHYQLLKGIIFHCSGCCFYAHDYHNENMDFPMHNISLSLSLSLSPLPLLFPLIFLLTTGLLRSLMPHQLLKTTHRWLATLAGQQVEWSRRCLASAPATEQRVKIAT